MAMAYMAAASMTRFAVHGDFAPPARVARAAEHADAVEIHGDVAAAVESDDPAFAATAAQLHLHHLVHRLRQRHAAVIHQRTHVVRDHLADVVLALPGAGHRTRLVVRIGSGADERGVADPAAVLVGESAGGSRGREIAGAIERDRADRAHAARTLGEAEARGGLGLGAGRLGAPRLIELVLARRGAE